MRRAEPRALCAETAWLPAMCLGLALHLCSAAAVRWVSVHELLLHGAVNAVRDAQRSTHQRSCMEQAIQLLPCPPMLIQHALAHAFCPRWCKCLLGLLRGVVLFDAGERLELTVMRPTPKGRKDQGGSKSAWQVSSLAPHSCCNQQFLTQQE